MKWYEALNSLVPSQLFSFMLGKKVWWISVGCFVQQTPRFWKSLIGVDNYKGHPLKDISLLHAQKCRMHTKQKNIVKHMAFIVVNAY